MHSVSWRHSCCLGQHNTLKCSFTGLDWKKSIWSCSPLHSYIQGKQLPPKGASFTIGAASHQTQSKELRNLENLYNRSQNQQFLPVRWLCQGFVWVTKDWLNQCQIIACIISCWTIFKIKGLNHTILFHSSNAGHLDSFYFKDTLRNDTITPMSPSFSADTYFISGITGSPGDCSLTFWRTESGSSLYYIILHYQ